MVIMERNQAKTQHRGIGHLVGHELYTVVDLGYRVDSVDSSDAGRPRLPAVVQHALTSRAHGCPGGRGRRPAAGGTQLRAQQLIRFCRGWVFATAVWSMPCLPAAGGQLTQITKRRLLLW